MEKENPKNIDLESIKKLKSKKEKAKNESTIIQK